jgi:hypothetical protein
VAQLVLLELLADPLAWLVVAVPLVADLDQ